MLTLRHRHRHSRDIDSQHLPAVGGHIGKNHPSFDARNFGFRRLSDLIRHQRYLECQETAPAEGSMTCGV